VVHVFRKLLIVVLVAAACSSVASASTGGSSDLARARQATAKFRNLDVAKAAGYGLLVDAAGIACIDKPGVGGMGVHYVNGGLVGDAAVDPAKPEALVYAPTESGRLRLVALEYVVFQTAWDAIHASPPTLFGQEFELVLAGNRYGLPAFYELHAWVWKHNPLGLFNDWNPRVTCTPATDDGGDDGGADTHD
jgi:hypothetical protein